MNIFTIVQYLLELTCIYSSSASSWWPTCPPSSWTSSTRPPSTFLETPSLTWSTWLTSPAWWSWPPSTCLCPPHSPAPLRSNLWRLGFSSTWATHSWSSSVIFYCRYILTCEELISKYKDLNSEIFGERFRQVQNTNLQRENCSEKKYHTRNSYGVEPSTLYHLFSFLFCLLSLIIFTFNLNVTTVLMSINKVFSIFNDSTNQ